jgi:hypothetical protein
MVGVWVYAFSGFSSRSGEQTLFSLEMAAGVLPQLLFSVALLVLLAKPLVDETPTTGLTQADRDGAFNLNGSQAVVHETGDRALQPMARRAQSRTAP